MDKFESDSIVVVSGESANEQVVSLVRLDVVHANAANQDISSIKLRIGPTIASAPKFVIIGSAYDDIAASTATKIVITVFAEKVVSELLIWDRLVKS